MKFVLLYFIAVLLCNVSDSLLLGIASTGVGGVTTTTTTTATTTTSATTTSTQNTNTTDNNNAVITDPKEEVIVQADEGNKVCSINKTTERRLNTNNDDYSKSSYDMLEHILANDYESIDGTVLINSINALKDRGAHRCWHKHSTFLEHLLNVHNILRLWGQGNIIGRVGLFHSAYSNSYVNLALYNPNTERYIMKSLIGYDAEKIVYLFCIIDRQEVVVNTLLKLGYIPKDGLSVPHLRNPNEMVYLSPETLRMLVVFSMADTAEQYFGWQDELFGPGNMLLPGLDNVMNHNPKSMWPGVSKPGLWMTYVNQLGIVAKTYQPEWSNNNNGESSRDDYNNNSNNVGKTLDVPPVFGNCTYKLTMEDELMARDLYWSVVMGDISEDSSTEIIATLIKCRQYNPWIFEPLVLLAQQYLYNNEHDKAAIVTKDALLLQQQWGIAWDKRLQFGAWVAWTRVLHQRAINPTKQSWPTNSWDVNNFGLVQ